MYYKRLILEFILVSVCLVQLFSCVPSKDEFRCNNRFIPLSSSIFTYDTDGKLDDKIIEQVFASDEYFARANYIWFTDSVNPIFWEILYSHSRSFYFDIFVDKRLLNMFTFVFTTQNTDSILGYIKQIQNVELPSESCYYFINGNKVIGELGFGTYDIYGFHNDTLVFRSIYPQLYDSQFYEFHEK